MSEPTARDAVETINRATANLQHFSGTILEDVNQRAKLFVAAMAKVGKMLTESRKTTRTDFSKFTAEEFEAK